MSRLSSQCLGMTCFFHTWTTIKQAWLQCGRGRQLEDKLSLVPMETSSKRYRVSFTTKDKNNKFIRYKPKDVDFFIVKCNGIDSFYIIPFRIAAECSYVNLYPHRIKQVYKGRVDWEVFRDNFDLPKKFQPLMKQKWKRVSFSETLYLDRSPCWTWTSDPLINSQML